MKAWIEEVQMNWRGENQYEKWVQTRRDISVTDLMRGEKQQDGGVLRESHLI